MSQNEVTKNQIAELIHDLKQNDKEYWQLYWLQQHWKQHKHNDQTSNFAELKAWEIVKQKLTNVKSKLSNTDNLRILNSVISC